MGALRAVEAQARRSRTFPGSRWGTGALGIGYQGTDRAVREMRAGRVTMSDSTLQAMMLKHWVSYLSAGYPMLVNEECLMHFSHLASFPLTNFSPYNRGTSTSTV